MGIDKDELVTYLESGNYGEEAENVSEDTVKELTNNRGDDE